MYLSCRCPDHSWVRFHPPAPVFRFDVLSTDVPMLIEIRDDSQMIRRAIDLADSISIVLSEVSAVLGGDKRGKC